jgi:hypothetical protein
MRQYATSFSERDKKESLRSSIKDALWYTTSFNDHNITFFFPWYGQNIRRISDEIINGINSGTITDIVDISWWWALDPHLKIWDFVFSEGDITPDFQEPISLNFRPEIEGIFRKIAEDAGRKFTTSKVLTTKKTIRHKGDRLELFKKTWAKVAQMEHYRFVSQIKSRVKPEAFEKLHISHLEIVSDEVPSTTSFIQSAWWVLKAINYWVISNQKHIWVFKTKFLQDFLK